MLPEKPAPITIFLNSGCLSITNRLSGVTFKQKKEKCRLEILRHSLVVKVRGWGGRGGQGFK